MDVSIKNRQFIECPSCQKHDFEVTHLLGRKIEFGSWTCDNCGQSITGKVEGQKINVEVRGRCRSTYCLIKASDSFVFVVHQWTEDDFTDEDFRYLIEESTCPENTLNTGVVAVVSADGVTDPHGLLKFGGAVSVSSRVEDVAIANLEFDDLDNMFQGLLSQNVSELRGDANVWQNI